MAYYAYKHVRDAIPNDFWEQYEKSWKEENGADFDGSADYDGSLWHMAASYIRHLQNRVAQLELVIAHDTTDKLILLERAEKAEAALEAEPVEFEPEPGENR